MKKRISFLFASSVMWMFIFLFLVGLSADVRADSLTIEKDANVSILIAGTSNPAIFTLHVKNSGESGNFEIYSLAGITINPKEIYLPGQQTTTFVIEADPNKYVRSNLKGPLIFEYELYSASNGITKDNLLFKFIHLKDLLEIKALPMLPGDDNMQFTVQNREDGEFDNINMRFNSQFSNSDKTISLKPYELVNVSVPIDQEKIKKIHAGTYTINIDLIYDGAKDVTSAELKYLEKSGLSVNEKKSGVIVRRTLSEKRNEGNVPVNATVSIEKNLLTRLLTTMSIDPSNVDKKGLFVTYNWNKMLAPGETLSVEVKTNYTMPFIILIVIIALVIVVKIYTRTHVILTKRVSFVRTKGGEFALRVKVAVKARHNVENLTLTDRIPHAMQVHESFTVKPSTLDAANRRIAWHIPSLHAGEERTFSYIIYSKVSIVGAFSLPLAHASYMKDGEKNDMYSNKTSFVSGTLEREE